jgi:hypothetical protein
MPLLLLSCVSLDRRDIQRRINGFSTSHTCSMSAKLPYKGFIRKFFLIKALLKTHGSL